MPDEYWLIVTAPRWELLPWPKKTWYFNKICNYKDIVDFVEGLKEREPNWTINIGITRGADIHVLG